VFIVGISAALKADDGSSSDEAEQSSTSSGDYASGSVALAVALGAVFAVLVIALIVFVVRRIRASQPKSSVDRQQADAATNGGPARVTGPLPSWGFDSIRSKYSITSEATVDDQLS